MSLRLTTYLVMNGNAKEAIDFYQKALDAKLLFSQSFGEMPENPEFPLPESAKSLISHAMIKIGDSDLMLSDTFPGQPHQSGNQVTICISTADPSQARQLYDALSQDGQVQMPLQDTFFSPSYGIVTDRFGITFHIYTEGKQ
ncbi:VOC family protein [Paenibacillus sp. S-38]|uniref:VOC family protein n=1 Tax=Paenibacillus sp. S-38 TaxID=3416710 RepID=UPI003CE720E8